MARRYPSPAGLESLAFEMSVALTIARCMIIKIVLSAINFNNEPLGEADKIRM